MSDGEEKKKEKKPRAKVGKTAAGEKKAVVKKAATKKPAEKKPVAKKTAVKKPTPRTVAANRTPVKNPVPGMETPANEEQPLGAPRPSAALESTAGREGRAGARRSQDVTEPFPPSPLTPEDLYLFSEGTHLRLWERFGAHPGEVDGQRGVWFTVWAPAAARVSVIGDWNEWQTGASPLERIHNADGGPSGVWSAFVSCALGVAIGSLYKFRVESLVDDYAADKADPFAFRAEVPPARASIVWPLDFEWSDGDWMANRAAKNATDAPISIYEVHLGSWRRVEQEGAEHGRPLSYREMAPALADYVLDMGFTHVELMPVMEHPFYGSWGYQITGFFAATSRYGTPQDLMFLIDYLHRRGIGVILDWVPSHFPTDEHGLGYFDGTRLYEHPDPRLGYHPDWGSLVFDYGRPEVRSFLASNALFWLEVFHADGLRVDAVASMIHRDYSRPTGQWLPNRFGGREYLEAIEFLKWLHVALAEQVPDAITIAEESTAFPHVTGAVGDGGLGFGWKWDMGWMHDRLEYFEVDPLFRKAQHGKLTFRAMYAGSERFVLPLSHDEVVHLKKSLAGKMPGDVWQKLANLRLLFADQIVQPGKKLLFMGGELAQWREWNHDQSLDWHLLEFPEHEGVRQWFKELLRLYRDEPALHQHDARPDLGFAWIDCDDAERSVLAVLRRSGREDSSPGDRGEAEPSSRESIVAVLNLTPVVRENYRLGVPWRDGDGESGRWAEIANSDDILYGGTGRGNPLGVTAVREPHKGWPAWIELTLPPLGALFLKPAPLEAPGEQGTTGAEPKLAGRARRSNKGKGPTGAPRRVRELF